MSQDDAPLAPADVAELPLFPLPEAVLFPGTALPLHVFEPRYRKLIADVLRGKRVLGIARLRPGFEQDYYGRPPLYEVCGVGRVIKDVALPDGRFNVVVLGLERARIVEELPFEPYRVARAELLSSREAHTALAWSSWYPKLEQLARRLSPHVSPADTEELGRLVREAPSAGACADRLAAALIADADERQRLLEELDPTERLTRVLARLHELASTFGAAASPPASELN